MFAFHHRVTKENIPYSRTQRSKDGWNNLSHTSPLLMFPAPRICPVVAGSCSVIGWASDDLQNLLFVFCEPTAEDQCLLVQEVAQKCEQKEKRKECASQESKDEKETLLLLHVLLLLLMMMRLRLLKPAAGYFQTAAVCVSCLLFDPNVCRLWLNNILMSCPSCYPCLEMQSRQSDHHWH